MLTILNAIELSSEYLNKKGVESSRINAEILLAHILNCKRLDLYMKFDQPLTEDETNEYRELIKRRGLREPLQYIIGKVEFYGLEFTVNRNVLIPRPETEILVEEIINQSDKNQSLHILDIGTGSGNIAISLAKNLLNSIITSIDINNYAVELAKENAKLNNLNGRLVFEEADINDYNLRDTQKFDVIVSNPPYISQKDYIKLEKELLEHEPKNALTDEADGFTFYSLISKKAPNLLNKNGKLYFEIAQGQADKVSELLSNNGFVNIKSINDYSGIKRIIIGEIA